jgi:hypothetical protein
MRSQSLLGLGCGRPTLPGMSRMPCQSGHTQAPIWCVPRLSVPRLFAVFVLGSLSQFEQQVKVQVAVASQGGIIECDESLRR